MVTMNLRFCIYSSVAAAALVCLVIDPELIGKSSIVTFFASIIAGTREAIASLW